MNGIEAVAKERQEQIEKHGRTIERDVRENSSYQLAIGAAKLLTFPADVNNHKIPPNYWDVDLYKKMAD